MINLFLAILESVLHKRKGNVVDFWLRNRRVVSFPQCRESWQRLRNSAICSSSSISPPGESWSVILVEGFFLRQLLLHCQGAVHASSHAGGWYRKGFAEFPPWGCLLLITIPQVSRKTCGNPRLAHVHS